MMVKHPNQNLCGMTARCESRHNTEKTVGNKSPSIISKQNAESAEKEFSLCSHTGNTGRYSRALSIGSGSQGSTLILGALRTDELNSREYMMCTRRVCRQDLKRNKSKKAWASTQFSVQGSYRGVLGVTVQSVLLVHTAFEVEVGG
jgi:hypothetical protein